MTLYYAHQYVTTQLSVAGGISDTDTLNITLQDVTGIDTTKPSIALLDYQDPLDLTKAEWITYTTINGSKVFQGVTRGAEGSIARTHSDGCSIAFPISESHINNLNDEVTDIEDPTANSFGFHNNSLYRQAIINGNFDVWQRGTSVAMTAANAYAADRWYCETATAATDKTVSRQDGTGVNGSYYCARVLAAQDTDELFTFSQALESQDSIKFRGGKVTLSFYARGGAEFVADNATLVSKIVTGKGADQKVLAFTTSADGVSQNNTLTTGWQKFTCTTTATIAADITQIGISFAFTHAGSGTTTNYFEVTQVQLCDGSVALPFMPKSFDEELRACMRYAIVLTYLDVDTVGFVFVGQGSCNLIIPLPVPMRTTPSFTSTCASFTLRTGGSNYGVSGISVSRIFSNSVQISATSSGSTGNTAGVMYAVGNGTVTLSSEL